MPPINQIISAATCASASAAACAVAVSYTLAPGAIDACSNSCSRQGAHCAASATAPSMDVQHSRSNGGGSGRKRGRSNSGSSRSNDKEPANLCEEYNSLKWRLSYASRRSDCNAEPSCVFVGRDIMGACTPRDPSLLQERDTRGLSRPLPNVPLVLGGHPGAKEETDVLRRYSTVRRMGESITELETELSTSDGDEDEAKEKFLAMMDELDVEESTQEHALAILKDEGLPAVKVFLKGQLATFASEELRMRKASTEAFAKDFLIQVLRAPELPSKMGQVLESVFKDPHLSTGTRHLIYNAVALDHTFKNALWLTRGQVTWLLTGTNWMDEEAIKLCAWLVRLPQTDLAAIPLVAWAVSEPGLLDPAAARALASSLPYGAETLHETMIWVATETLQADWALDLAKDTAKYMMLFQGEEDLSAAKSDAANSGKTSEEKSGVKADDDAGTRAVTEGTEDESFGAHVAVTPGATTGAGNDESNVDAEAEVAVDVDDDIGGSGDDYDSMQGFED